MELSPLEQLAQLIEITSNTTWWLIWFLFSGGLIGFGFLFYHHLKTYDLLKLSQLSIIYIYITISGSLILSSAILLILS